MLRRMLLPVVLVGVILSACGGDGGASSADAGPGVPDARSSVFPDGNTADAGPCGAADFNGANSMGVADIPATLASASVTAAVWFRADTLGAHTFLLNKLGDVAGGSDGYSLSILEGKLRARVTVVGCTPGTCTGANFHDVVGPDVVVGRWTHAAVTHDEDGGETRLYVDGAEVAMVSGDGPIIYGTPDAPFTVATTETQTGPALFFDGLLTDVTTYPHALTPADVMAVMYGTGPSGASARYTLTDVTGSSEPDLTQNGHRLVLTAVASLVSRENCH